MYALVASAWTSTKLDGPIFFFCFLKKKKNFKKNKLHLVSVFAVTSTS